MLTFSAYTAADIFFDGPGNPRN